MLHSRVFLRIAVLAFGTYVVSCYYKHSFDDSRKYDSGVVNIDKGIYDIASQSELFQQIPVSEVKKYWDKKPCNSGWNFPGLTQGTKEWFIAVEKRRYKVEPHSYDFAGFATSGGLRVLEIGGGICTD